ncbi:MAG: heme o synthase [Planctomycetota bacterium]|jgi:protoheme IX farnesyltransferase
MRDWISLAKPRITLMVMGATWLGACIAAGGWPAGTAVWAAVVGAGLASAGTAALNMALEHRSDARMTRTASRPIAAGRIAAWHGGVAGIAWAALGIGGIAFAVNGLAAALTAATVVSYLAAYTPLKARSRWCVWVGAIPGAIPPMIGWTAVTGTVGPGAWLLFAIVIAWQMPHVEAVAWMHRRDYAANQWFMHPFSGRRSAALVAGVAVSCTILVALSIAPALTGWTGPAYGLFAAVIGLAFSALSTWFAWKPTRERARSAFLASLAYLPALLVALSLAA